MRKHKPYIISVLVLFTVIGMVSRLDKPKPVVAAPVKPAIVSMLSNDDVPELAYLINQERTKAGLLPLIEDGRLEAAAQAHCDDMIAANVYSHNMPDGRTPLDYIVKQVGSSKPFAYAENNSYGWSTDALVVTGWMGSPGHRDNILSKAYSSVGYAICSGSNYTAPGLANPTGALVVQDFAGIL